MLDAYGKGAAGDIQKAKSTLYSQLTYDAASNTSYSLPVSVIGKDKSDTTNGNGHSNAYQGGHEQFERMPSNSLDLIKELATRLRSLVILLQTRLRELPADQPRPRHYSALLMSPYEWDQLGVTEGKQPCENEKMLLLHDRWRKLYRGFYLEKKGMYDCSKIPDIYDSSKYDLIHNSHLDLPFRELFEISQSLAHCVIPNEYGTKPETKLHIGSCICSKLLGKLMVDLDNMREESVASVKGQSPSLNGSDLDVEINMNQQLQMRQLELASLVNSFAGEEEGDESDDGYATHRLCPTYADNINSPLRHVRTRIYFTSESHIYSLVHVLRFSHIENPDLPPLLSPSGYALLEATAELDYMAHLVIRMFERKNISIEDDKRFYIQIHYSNGAFHDPQEALKNPQYENLIKGHILPTTEGHSLHPDGGIPLFLFHQALDRYSTPWKRTLP
eukprot:NODE_959_length_2221_cov_38.303622_g820_i0.p1 GENE.NODE_959_length_2221_cov_38.303622_g820_i0~~NODE_959_length_2221_cov_38.303622_g820_i0.p1  ORF type:complete len:446 (-),score=85.44 NODE_959_length_2221_cov_38.303622_g820_i0:289-1626(-)